MTPSTAPATGQRSAGVALAALLLGTSALYLWRLGDSGWANAYYSAAAQAGSQSWKALFFGSTDAANSITVDKTPLSIWVMALSVRAFGLNAWSILVPQALAGVAAVALLYASVRRWFGPAAGWLAGVTLAITPVAALMFRFNNPDALLVLLLVAAAYAVVRALERGSTRWLVLAGALVGFAFLTKMLQALLVLPAFGAAYLLAGPAQIRRRTRQLGMAAMAMIGAGAWWVAIVELTPARHRPYIGGSQHNSVVELTLGQSGLAPLTGEETGSSGLDATGWTRLLGPDIGGQVGWLLPAAVLLLTTGLMITLRAPRTDRTRAALVLWGGWLLVTAVVFSFMGGIFHAHYTVALAPAVGALVGIGTTLLWRRRANPLAAAALAAILATTAGWSVVLLGRAPDWHPWLRPTVLMIGLVAAIALAQAARLSQRTASVVATVGLISALGGPAAYAMQTAATAHAGAVPSAGPALLVAGKVDEPSGRGTRTGTVTDPHGGGVSGRIDGPAGSTEPPAGSDAQQADTPADDGPLAGDPAVSASADGPTERPDGQLGGGPGANLVALLTADAGRYDWVAAMVGTDNAAGYQLATGEPVMAIGGCRGSDPSPTLARFQQLVANGKIHYLITGGAELPGRSGSASRQITLWVMANFSARTVDGVTVYDLTVAV